MTELLETPLHAAHVAAGAKMVDFGGWHMPLQYAGILAEHRAVREGVGIFDASHMGQTWFRGPKALDAVQKLVTNDAAKLADGQAQYAAICLPSGGIVDDCIVYRYGPEDFRIVINASNIAKDTAHFREHAGDICEIVDRSDEVGIIAVQGPEARELCARVAGEAIGAQLLAIDSFGLRRVELAGQTVVAARTGYTGEDGFELFVPAAGSEAVWSALVEAGATPCGLGARDTLRLEARLCLYGADIDETTTPYEAGLGWIVKLKAGDFVGREALVKQKQAGVTRKLVGFRVVGKGTARHGWDISAPDSEAVVGQVTSGGPAPTLGCSIGMGYVPTALSKPGTPIALRSRHKTLDAEIVKGPFYRRDQA